MKRQKYKKTNKPTDRQADPGMEPKLNLPKPRNRL